MIGVNGVGKTTTIGKLAHRYQANERSVLLAAGDTFRAAAVEQLKTWGERNGVPVIAQDTGADSASVLFDACESAKARGTDIVLADTAGRLQNKANLMNELEKIGRVLGKLDIGAPHEVLLVLDAGTGQNAISQAREFFRKQFGRQAWFSQSSMALRKVASFLRLPVSLVSQSVMSVLVKKLKICVHLMQHRSWTPCSWGRLSD